jgi:cysteine desulfurase
MQTYYLDTAATTKPLNAVLDAIKPYVTDKFYNPSALYGKAVEVKKDIEVVRENVAKLINADSNEIYFTSGATESNNWIIRGFDDANYYNESVIITTPIEHKSIIDAVNNPVLQSDIHFCKVDSEGIVDINSLKALLEQNKEKKILVSVIMANNEIGTVQNIQKISKLVHSYNGILHTDATQALKYISIDVKEMGIDMLSASAQKLGGLKGTGFLYKRNDINLSPLIYGEQENRNRGGTENVIGIIALGEAIKHIDYESYYNLIYLRNHFIFELGKLGCTVNGSVHYRLPNNINVTFLQDVSAENMVYVLDMCGIYVSTGSACSANSTEISHVLEAIGLSKEDAMKTIRITLPDDITMEDIDKVVCNITKQIVLLTTE